MTAEPCTTREQWLAARKNGIGASEAAVIMGVSAYKTNVELWEEKTGRREPKEVSDPARVAFGKQAEAAIRELFALDHPQYRVDYDEFGMIRNNPAAPWAFATLDGELTEAATGRKGVLEIKTAEIMQSAQWRKWDERIPDAYYWQVIHQLMATLYPFVILKARIKQQRDGELRVYARHYSIETTDEGVPQDMERLMEKEARFWECVETGRKPSLALPPI